VPKVFEQRYKLSDESIGSSDTFNPIYSDLDARIGDLEDAAEPIQEMADQIQANVLLRVDTVLTPAIQSILEIQEKGFLVAASNTSILLQLGTTPTFVVPAGSQRDLFTPGPFVALSRLANFNDWAIIRTIGYDAAHGEYTGQVMAVYGDPGPWSDWVLVATVGESLAQRQMLDAAIALQTLVTAAKGLTLDYRDAAQIAATAAAQSATRAQQFAQLYLGPLPADPTVGALLPDGTRAALQVGNLYMKTTATPPVLRSLISMAPNVWQDAAAPANFIPIVPPPIIATEGQTVFPIGQGFDGVLAVFLDTAVLVGGGDDYGLNSPNVTLTKGAPAGAVFTFIGYQYRTTPPATPAYLTGAETNTAIATASANLLASFATPATILASAATNNNATLVNRQTLYADTTAGVVSAILPASPAADTIVRVAWEKGTNVFTLKANGQTIKDLAGDLIYDSLQGTMIQWRFIGGTWKPE
jgi:hypothetical protein